MNSKFKKLSLFVFSFALMQSGWAQTDDKHHRNATVRIDTRHLEDGIEDVFRTVALEVSKIDFSRIGDVVNAAVGGIDIDVDGESIIVIQNQQRQEPEYPEEIELVGTAEKSRLISKTYIVDRDDKLAVNNQYGKVAVHVWAKNEIKVDIEIKAYESSESSAQNLLESVDITDIRQNNLISFKTSFEKTSVNFWSRIKNGKEERRGVQVNYNIYMPARNALDITNRYGSTVLPDFSGPVKVNSSYGSLVSGRLDNPANDVKVSYGSASMENYSHGNLSVAYGSLKLAQANKVNATIKYSSARIARLNSGGSFNIAYSSGFRIEDVDADVKNLMINSSYSGVTLGIDESADFNFDVTVSYAGFNYNDSRISLVNQLSDSGKGKSWNPTKNYRGSIGKGSDSRIIIKSNYGGVRFL